VRPIGFDIQKEALVLKKGTLLRPAEIGILATVGCDKVAAYRKPRVAVMSTGDELIEPNQPLTPGYAKLASFGRRDTECTDL